MKQLNDDPHVLKVFTRGNGAPVVLLHGQVYTHHYMSDVTKILAKKRRAYSFDLLGFGDSPRPKNATYSLNQHPESIHMTLQSSDIAVPFMLVGHSMGAQLALAFAKKYSHLVSSIVAVGLPLCESKENAYKQIVALNPQYAWLVKIKQGGLLRFLPWLAEAPLGLLSVLFNRGTFSAHIARDAVRTN